MTFVHQLASLTARVFTCAATIAFVASVSTFSSDALAQNWPQFRGPKSAATSDAKDLPLKWDDKTNIAWKQSLPGFGASSPVVFDDRIYVTCYSGYGLDKESPGEKADLNRHLLCRKLDTGESIWEKSHRSDTEARDYQSFVALHGYASSTPAVDDSGIYVFYGSGGAVAYDHDGELLWEFDCGTTTHVFGTANSPLIAGNIVIINASVESGDLIGLDKATGEERWRAKNIEKSWNTPVLVETADGKTEMVVNTKGQVIGFDPSTGEKLWFCSAIDDYICPSVLVEGDVVYALGGRKNTAVAIKTGGKGDVTESHKLWQIRIGSNVSSPVFHDGHLYWASEKKEQFYCVRAEDGEIVFRERVTPRPNLIYASPVIADGKIYLVSRERGTYVFAAKPEYELLSINTIKNDESIFNGSPAITGNRIILRSDKFLYAIGKE